MDIDLISTESFASGHPWDQYAWLRENAPVYRHPDPFGDFFWALTKYEDVRAVSRQPQLFSSYERGVMVGEATSDEELFAQRQMMLNMDPPQHERYRRLVSRGFTPRQAQMLKDRIDGLAREIVGDVAGKGECDLVSDIAGRLPSGLIAEMMGIPRADGERLYELTEIMHTTDPSVASPEKQLEAVAEMLIYADGVARQKRAHPAEDIASTLVHSEVEGDVLTDSDFQWFFLLLVNAGGDTTRNLVASGMQLLFEHPDQRARLTSDLDRLLPTAVEEMLRYTSPVSHFRRTTMQDTMIHGQPITAGQKVLIFYGSANRDEEVFERPQVFDVGRDPNPHLAFGGGGAHLCLGMHVARVEIASLLREMLTTLPDVSPAGEPKRLASSFIVGYHSLPVKFTPAA
ncbi:MAG TPA: cytochrome P450 [Acidimicrobiales bacterium]|nr:cytochrome P450 [Acidimicrobiales bacterium]